MRKEMTSVCLCMLTQQSSFTPQLFGRMKLLSATGLILMKGGFD